MSEQSGTFGLVAGKKSIRNWSFDVLSETVPMVMSGTRAGTVRRTGPRDWSGQYLAAGGAPPVMPGEFFEFIGFTGPEEDYTEGNSGPTYRGQAIVDSVELTINWETGEIISSTTNFSGDGAVVEDSDSFTETGYPDVPSSSLARAVLMTDDGDEVVESGEETVICATTLTLTITSATAEYVNSCTGNWKRRKRGPIDWTMNIVQQEASLAALPYAIGDVVWIRIYLDASNEVYWDLKWGIVKEFTGITVDQETSTIISETVVIEMSAITDDEADGIGRIRVPGWPNEDWWPKGEYGLNLARQSDPFDEDNNVWLKSVDHSSLSIDAGEMVFGLTSVLDDRWYYQRVWLEEGHQYRIEAQAIALDVTAPDTAGVYIYSPSAVNTAVLAFTNGADEAVPTTKNGNFTAVETGYHELRVGKVGSLANNYDITLAYVRIQPYN